MLFLGPQNRPCGQKNSVSFTHQHFHELFIQKPYWRQNDANANSDWFGPHLKAVRLLWPAYRPLNDPPNKRVSLTPAGLHGKLCNEKFSHIYFERYLTFCIQNP